MVRELPPTAAIRRKERFDLRQHRGDRPANIALSSRTREGLDKWLQWLNALQQNVRQEAAAASV